MAPPRRSLGLSAALARLDLAETVCSARAEIARIGGLVVVGEIHWVVPTGEVPIRGEESDDADVRCPRCRREVSRDADVRCPRILR